MEKLTGLLNEWSKTALENKCTWVDMYDEDGVYFLNLFNRKMTMEMEDVISKRNGFIKWLVENNKIDLDNEELISLMSELRERRNPTKCLLMLLSIQDEPIRFLCEMLKDE